MIKYKDLKLSIQYTYKFESLLGHLKTLKEKDPINYQLLKAF